MGGYGSGGGRYGSGKHSVEDGFKLDINFIVKNGGITPRSAVLTWFRNEERIGSIGYKITFNTGNPRIELNFTCNGESVYEPIHLVSTPQPFGNERYWMLCPILRNGVPCHRRCCKLYQPPNSKYFGCRDCMNLTYQSCKDCHKFDGLYSRLAGDLDFPVWAIRKALKY